MKHMRKTQTPQPTQQHLRNGVTRMNRPIKRSVGWLCVLGAMALTGCASKDLSVKSTTYYHAPGQAYNLFLGSPALHGQPTLRESCSEHGSSVEIVDAMGDFFKIDVLNLKSIPEILKGDSEDTANAIAATYKKIYSTPFVNAPTFAKKINSNKQLYIPLPLDEAGPVAKDGRVVGMLITRYGDLLFNVQHVQHKYSEKLMLEKLAALQSSMSVPGLFPFKQIKKKKKASSDKSSDDTSENHGFITIDTTSASREDILAWRKAAKCS